VIASLLLVSSACKPESTARATERLARRFYTALNAQEFDRARSMLTNESALDRLLDEFGDFPSWADRVTKNGIIAHIQPVERSTSDGIADLEVLVMFHDGTRRTDFVRAVIVTSNWKIDAASVIGSDGANEP